MDKEFVPYQLALRLKELGFDEQCMRYYNPKNKGLLVLPERMSTMHNTKNSSVEHIGYCSAPLWQQAFDWFRVQHNINVSWDCENPKYINILIHKHFEIRAIRSYDKAKLRCLETLIDIIENNGM